MKQSPSTSNRHAVIIIWHRNIGNLIELLEYFDENFRLFIHIDKKAKNASEILEILKEDYPRCFACSKYNVKWGGRSIIDAELYLMKQILNEGIFDRIHILSGEDFPLRPLHEFMDFFNQNERQEFIQFHKLPYSGWNHGGMSRIEQWWFNDVVDMNRYLGLNFTVKFADWQRRHGIRRNTLGLPSALYAGSNWMSVTTECIRDVFFSTDRFKKFRKFLKFSFAPDEIFFQTAIMNSEYSGMVVNSNLRFIDWSWGLPSPAYMTEKHIHPARGSGAFFARKVGKGISDVFCNAIRSDRDNLGV